MRKILVVDDEPDVPLLYKQRFRRELRRGEIDLHFASSGAEVLEYFQEHGRDGVVLVLSDINMPGMTGLELLKALREQHPDLCVFMVTAYDDEQNYQTAQAYGANDYFTKPIDFTTLKEKIARL